MKKIGYISHTYENSVSIFCQMDKKRYQSYDELDFDFSVLTPVTFNVENNLAVDVSPIRLHMMVGVQGSGKSTFIKKNFSKLHLISTDAYIERMSGHTGLTYSQLFQDNYEDARKYMHTKLNILTKNCIHFVWDQMNLTRKTRAAALSKIPKVYEKFVYYFEPPPLDILEARIKSRIGKNIPMEHVIESIESLEIPKLDEGFTKIIGIKYNKNA